MKEYILRNGDKIEGEEEKDVKAGDQESLWWFLAEKMFSVTAIIIP